MLPYSNAFVTKIEVNLGAISHNLNAIRQHIGSGVQLLAVVKANAYGHGLLPVAHAAMASRADSLAVARVEEGIALRQGGITAPILVMNYSADMQAAIAYGLTPTITELDVAEHLSRLAHESIDVHIKVDTGMGRFGVLPDEFKSFFGAVKALPRIRVQGLYTHFATADDADHTYTQQQFDLFQSLTQDLDVPLRHAANSGGTLYHSQTHLDAVRVGIATYGLQPNAELLLPFALRPAMRVASRLVRVKSLPAGSSIGYGQTYRTAREMLVGLIPIGYGDGYHRLLSNRGAVLVNGQRAPIIGRVSMDQTIVDLSNCGEARIGDEVVILGELGAERVTAEDIAGWSETINYEVTTSLLPRLPRQYLKDSKI